MSLLNTIKKTNHTFYMKKRQQVSPLLSLLNSIDTIRNSSLSVNDKNKKAKQFLLGTAHLVNYPDYDLSDNWLILKSQLADIRWRIIETICTSNTDTLDDYIHHISKLRPKTKRA